MRLLRCVHSLVTPSAARFWPTAMLVNAAAPFSVPQMVPQPAMPPPPKRNMFIGNDAQSAWFAPGMAARASTQEYQTASAQPDLK